MADLPEKLRELKKAYNRLFKSDDGKIVLEDLRKVCFVKDTTINESSNMMAFSEGHRGVWLHIEGRMNLANLIAAQQAQEESDV